MKIFAGLKLKYKKPRALPARAAVSTATNQKFSSTAIKKIVTAAITDTPAANPSNPSIRFSVLVRLTTQINVIGIAHISR